jgi:hypothetical protein
MDRILALYDIAGIQDFIFSSNKLKENVGASIIVQQVLEDFFEGKDGKGIKTVCTKKTALKWKEIKGLAILNDDDLEVEVVYIGGGNAMAAYRDQTVFKNVTRELSKTIIEKTGATLHAAVTYTKIGDNFDFDYRCLTKKLKEYKLETPRTFPLPGIAVTRESPGDGLPSVQRTVDDGEFVSFPAYKKRSAQEDSSYFEKKLLDDKQGQDFLFPKELDHLGQVEGENHIAVVHIDGNNMGDILEQIIAGVKDYHTAVNKIKKFSKQVSDRYTGVMKGLIRRLIHALENENFVKELNIRFQEKSMPLYIRPLVLDGDDVTFVVDGRIGIPAAEAFLEQLSKQTIDNGDKKIPLTACAGVAIVKSHFPFYRAYRLAEELCRSAKLKGKLLARSRIDNNDVGHWLDFHIVYSGVTTGLDKLREKNYSVPGKKSLEPLQFSRFKRVIMQKNQFHLLWRPWCVAGEVEKQYRWSNLKEILQEFKDQDQWPRSRLKNLRNQSLRSETDIRMLLSEFKSREWYLPEFNGKRDYFIDGPISQSPYFDALELLDFYLDIPVKEVVE